MKGTKPDVPRKRMHRIMEKAAEEADAGENHEIGLAAELIVAEHYGVTHDNDQAWYDARHPDTGTKYEVKSCHMNVGDEYPAPGRFRLWEDQARSLQASSRKGTAWYVFLLWDDNDSVKSMRRMKPDTVDRIVKDLGGWNQNDGPTRDGAGQRKVPWGVIF